MLSHGVALSLAFELSSTQRGLQEKDAKFQFEVVDETHEANPAVRHHKETCHRYGSIFVFISPITMANVGDISIVNGIVTRL